MFNTKCIKCNRDIGFWSTRHSVYDKDNRTAYECDNCYKEWGNAKLDRDQRHELAKRIQNQYISDFSNKVTNAIKKNDSNEILNIYRNLDVNLIIPQGHLDQHAISMIQKAKVYLPVIDELSEIVENKMKEKTKNVYYLDVEYILRKKL